LFLPARVAAAVAKIFLYAKEPTVKRMQDRIKKKKTTTFVKRAQKESRDVSGFVRLFYILSKK